MVDLRFFPGCEATHPISPTPLSSSRLTNDTAENLLWYRVVNDFPTEETGLGPMSLLPEFPHPCALFAQANFPHKSTSRAC